MGDGKWEKIRHATEYVFISCLTQTYGTDAFSNSQLLSVKRLYRIRPTVSKVIAAGNQTFE